MGTGGLSGSGELDGAAPDLFARLSLASGVLRAALSGPSIGQREGSVIASMIEKAIAGASTPLKFVVLDFTDVEFINSAGLGSCIVIHNRTKSAGATCVLYAMRDNIRDVFRMTRLDKLFKAAEDEKKLEKLIK